MKDDQKVFCPKYQVWNSKYACAKRYENANGAYFHPTRSAGPGHDDLACLKCEIGQKLFEAGESKKKAVSAPLRKGGVLEEEKTMKVCSKCGEEKLIDAFYRHPTTKDGRDNVCKTCKSAADKSRKAAKNKPKTAPTPEQPFREYAAKRIVISLDFSSYPDVIRKLTEEATAEFRTPEGQAMYILTQYMMD